MNEVHGRYGTYSVEAEPFSKGGVGAIYRTDDPAFVYKRYFDAQKAPELSALERLIEVGQDVLVRQRRVPGDTPESSVNWPVDVVSSERRGVQGVVLPIIPQALFHEESGGVRTLDFLVMARAKPPAAKGRVALLLRMAELLAYVDHRGLVHGDINGKNLAWSVRPAPIMYLIDCDGMVAQSPPPQHGVQAMGWTDPRIIERLAPAHDHLSDRYALALAMYRGLLLTPGKLDKGPNGVWGGPKRIPDSFPEKLRALLLNGLEPLEGSKRPPASEWVDALSSIYIPNGAFDDERLRELDALSRPAKPAPTFRPLPPLGLTDPQSAPQVHAPNQLPAPTVTQPVVTPNSPQVTVLTPVQPLQNSWQPTPAWQAPAGQLPQPTGLALTAIRADWKWYLIGALASFLLWPASAIYIAIALYQLKKIDGAYPGRERAQAWLIVFASVDVAMALYFFIAVF